MSACTRALLVVALACAGARASGDAARGSVQGLADDVASAVAVRAAAEGLAGGARIVLDEVRGLDPARVRAALMPRLRKALTGPIMANDAGPLTLTLALSEEQGHLWAVVVLDGRRLSSPSTIVVRHAIDRELEAALGAASRRTAGRLVLERVAPLPPPASGENRRCPVLDAALVDIDGDPANELAVLSRCGVTVYRVGDDVTALSPTIALPKQLWPRVALGWLTVAGTADAGPIVWASTSAGHSVFVDVRGGRVVDAPPDRVPLRGVMGKDGPHALHWRLGSPSLELPLLTPGGVDVLVPGLPARVRDLARLPGDAWLFVADDGTLAVRDESGEVTAVSPERCGDRALVLDLDGDNDLELVTTSASSPGEPDQLVVRRLSPGYDGSTVVLKSPLGGGSIAALASGHADFDQRTDVLLIEELADGDHVVWQLEHAP
jgi:hypothetical protein